MSNDQDTNGPLHDLSKIPAPREENSLPPEVSSGETDKAIANDIKPSQSAAEPMQSLAGRSPLVPIAIAVAVGIIFDRYATASFFWLFWGGVGCVAIWFVGSLLQRLGVATLALLAAIAIIGAIHHHGVWFARPMNDIGQFLSSEQTLIKVRGTVVDKPQVKSYSSENRPRWQNTSSTRFVLQTDSFVSVATDSAKPVLSSVTGKLQVVVYSRKVELAKGDRIEVMGKASAISPAANPGEWDFETYLKRQRIRGNLRVAAPELVTVIEQSNNPFFEIQSRIRDRCEQFVKLHMSHECRPIASALLLGDRTTIPTDVRSAFIESGAMHLLAISGLHIGILTIFIYGLTKIVGFGDRLSVLVVLAVLGFYLSIADLRPPMIRAFTLVAVWGVGRMLGRGAFSANSLAAAAIVVLTIDPTSLFDVGAQLSFLAVATIMWLIRVTRDRTELAKADQAAQQDRTAANDFLLPVHWRLIKWIWSRIRAAWLVSFTVSLVSAPLVASAFNVISLIGVFVNVVLIPAVSIALCCGFVGMILSCAWMPLGKLPSWVFDQVLCFVLWIVDLASEVELGHFYVPSPPLWWLLGMYGLIGAAMVAFSFRTRSVWSWVTLTGWLLFGLSMNATSRPTGELTCTFLSVRHGCCILVEMPNERVLVYDVGSQANPARATRVLEAALWQRGIRKVDVLVLSHADADHYNGASQFLEHVPVGQVLYSDRFCSSSQPDTHGLCQQLADLQIPTYLIRKGHRINLDERVDVEVLHPTDQTSGEDNALSLVILFRFAGRSILLTGDLEEPGLSELLGLPQTPIDIMLSPHHGGVDSNTEELADWATPRWVVVSAGKKPNTKIDAVYDSARVFWTSRDGAVSFRVNSNGEITPTRFLRDQSRPKLSDFTPPAPKHLSRNPFQDLGE